MSNASAAHDDPPTARGVHSLSPIEIDELMHFAHGVAVRGGHHQRFVDARYPGWRWAEIAENIISAHAVDQHLDPRFGVLQRAPRCVPGLRAIVIAGPRDWLARWDDGTMTASR